MTTERADVLGVAAFESFGEFCGSRIVAGADARDENCGTEESGGEGVEKTCRPGGRRRITGDIRSELPRRAGDEQHGACAGDAAGAVGRG